MQKTKSCWQVIRNRWQSTREGHVDISRPYRGWEAALTWTLHPLQRSTSNTHREGSRSESSVPPINHSALGISGIPALHKLCAAEHKQPESFKLCSLKIELQTPLSADSLSKERREYLSPATCYTLEIGNENKKMTRTRTSTIRSLQPHQTSSSRYFYFTNYTDYSREIRAQV